jgi:predicted AAA+ superfamily ATPase
LKYLTRIYDDILRSRLESSGAVLVEGAKWCGKTTTSRQLAKSTLLMADPASREQNLLLADTSPSVLLEGDNPRLIDEWQIAPKLWDAVRFEVDQRNEFNQFILTGSSVPASTKEITHSGTGRISRITMRPMSLFESLDSSGSISLSSLFSTGKAETSQAGAAIEELAYWTCRGGWPRAIDQPERIALRQAIDYFDAVSEIDISQVDGVERNPTLAKRLMRSFARMISTQGRVAHILKDLKPASASVSLNTVQSYLDALQRIFVIENMPAWNPNLRSKTAIRTSDTWHFVDPSIATAALGMGPADLISDLETFGLLFESMCVRDLRVYTDALDGDVFHYRDKTGLECDAVIHLRNGHYGLIEIKLGGDRLIEEGAANLLKLASKLDTDRMNSPSFLAVVTGVGAYSFQRPDGVNVVPISTLKA